MCKPDPVRKCRWPFIPAMKMPKKIGGREEYQASHQDVVKDRFYYEVDLRMFLQKPDSTIMATYSYKDVK